MAFVPPDGLGQGGGGCSLRKVQSAAAPVLPADPGSQVLCIVVVRPNSRVSRGERARHALWRREDLGVLSRRQEEQVCYMWAELVPKVGNFREKDFGSV